MATNDNLYAAPIAVADVLLYPTPGPQGPVGPPGPQGPVGDASTIASVWSGTTDPPDLVPGAKPGDTWINTTTGDTFILQ